MHDIISQILADKELLAELSAAGLIIADICMGKIPDRFWPYIGVVRRISEYIERKKSGNRNR